MENNHAEEAISLAMQGRWTEAAMLNERIVEAFPNDIDAHNRLGKALTELGQYPEAREAYERVLLLDSSNGIAKRNLERLTYLHKEDRSPKDNRRIDSKFFIEETNKAKMVNLYRIAPRETLAKMAGGDEVYLQINGMRLEIINDSKEYLGEVEPKISSRLIELIEGGNEYRAAIISLRDDIVKIIIRETFQHPSQAGQLSFSPTRTVEELKPYLKDTLVKYDIDDDFTDEPEELTDWESEPESLEPDDVSPEGELSIIKKGKADKVI
ncbi:MAG: tetratricopeptide repeat protein [Chloroflexota bacterium]|nr:tetratricopeptide repeat protein [Chloroflexota bacterium]